MSRPPRDRQKLHRASFRGWLGGESTPAARRWRRLRLEGLERRDLLAVLPTSSHELNFYSDHSSGCCCPICTGAGLAPVVPVIGFATAPGQGSPLTSLPQLRSHPTATAKLFLDFDGHFEAAWGTHTNVTTPVFDADSDPSTFSSGELDAIREIWQRVAEDYAPFNIDVTTIDPGTQANNVAATIAIGGSSHDWYGITAGGISFIGGFSSSSSNVGYAFSITLGGTAKNVAEAAAHEAGHLFGLQHQARWNGSTLVEQYHSGGGGWAPIMGVSYAPARTTWFNGATPFGPAILQDDLLLLAGATNGFGWKADDYGNTLTAAAALPISGNNVQLAGLIGRNDDQDVWSFSTIGGLASFQLTGAAIGTNLDAVLEVRNAGGQTVALADPSDTFGAAISSTLPAGNYYLLARSTGVYGSLGQYTIAGTVVQQPLAEITLLQNAQLVTDGQAIDFGATPRGTGMSRTFTVRNDGAATLTLTALNPASLPAGFALEANLGQLTLAPGQSTTFAVRLTAATAGLFGGPLQLASNDADENPFDLVLSGIVTAPDIALQYNAAPLSDGQTLDIGSQIQGSSSTLTFSVLNTGTDALLLMPFDPASLPAGLSVVANLSQNSLPAGQSTTFVLRFDAITAGTWSGALRLVSSDPDESPFDLQLTATVLAPEIEMALEGVNVADGGGIGFGLTAQGRPVTRTISVTNAGTAPLLLTPLSAAILPAGYSLVANLGATSLAAGQATFITVQLNAQAGGNFSGTLQLLSNDADESPFELALTGQVLAPDITVLFDGSPVPSGGVLDFGAASFPQPILKTINIRNDGAAPLTLAPLGTASLPAGFSLAADLNVTTLAPAQSASFTLRLEGSVPGTFGGAWQIVSDDADENPFPLTLTGRIEAPEISLTVNGAGVSDGGVVHFGNFAQGQPAERTFTVQNDGGAVLQLAPLNAATLPAGFTVAENLGASSLAPGAATSFTLRLLAEAPGLVSGNWSIGNNDLDENPFDLELAATVTAPEIAVEVDGLGVADGGAVDFSVTTPGVAVVRRFTIRNEGLAPLTLAPLSPGTLPFGFSLIADQGLTTLSSGQTTSFVVRLDSAAVGTFGGTWALGNSDGDENPFDLTLTGQVATAEIDVLLGGQSLSDGQAVSFGTAVQGQPVTYEFVIVNRGGAALNLVPLAPALMPSGLSLLANIAQTQLPAGGSTTFAVRLDAVATGVFGGTLSLGNTDVDENPFDLTVSGTVTAPEIVVELGTANLPSGQTVDFGTTPRGTVVERSVTIRNAGSATLNLAPLQPAGLPAGFSLVANLGQTSLAPGATTSFAVRLDAAAAGNFGGAISLPSNDADENPFRFIVSGRVTVPDIALRAGATPLFSGQSYHFGTTVQGQPVERVFTIVNQGQAVLHLARPSADTLPRNFSLAAPLGQTVLAPGQSTAVGLRLDAAVGGPVSESWQLFSTDPDENPFELTLTGNVLAPEISIESSGAELASNANVDFGGTVLGLAAERTFVVRNVGTAPLDLTPLDAASLPAGFALAANLAAGTLAPGAADSFTLRLSATHGGAFAGPLQLFNSDADESPFELQLRGSVAASRLELTVDGVPVAGGPAIDFGATESNVAAVRTFTVRNRGAAALVLQPLTTSNLPAAFAIVDGLSRSNLPPGASATFSIRFQAATPGIYGGSISLGSNDPAAGVVSLSLTGQVVTPEIAVQWDGNELAAGQTLDFGVAAQGQPVVRTLVVRNLGSSPLAIAELAPAALPAGFSVIGDLLPTLLPAGETTSLTLRLDATQAGDYGGDFALVSNDDDESPFALSLRGRVIAPEITVLVNGVLLGANATVDFGSLPLGGASSRTFTVRNDGDAPLQLAGLLPSALPAGYTLVANLGATTLTQGQSSSFTIRLGGPAAGVFSGPLELANSDSDEGRFVIQLQGVLAAAEIGISMEGVELTSGQTVDWGDTLRGNALVRTFTITNRGAAPLDLTPLNPATLPAGFQLLSNIDATTLAPNAQATLTLRFDATSSGSFGGEVALGNSDADESPFRLNLSARAIDLAAVRVTVNLPAGGGDYTLAIEAGRLRLARGGETLLTRSLATVESLTIQGTAAAESLSVSYASGSPLPVGGVRWEAGGSPSGDRLSLSGMAGESVEWSAGDLAAAAGMLASGGRVLTYAGVRQLDLSAFGQAKLQLSGASHAVSIADGQTQGGSLPALILHGTAGTQPLPVIALAGNGTVAIAANGSAADVIALESASSLHGNQHLSIDTGVSAGDRIDLIGTAAFAGVASLTSRQISFTHDASRLLADRITLTAATGIADASPALPSALASELTATAGSGIVLGVDARVLRARVTGPGELALHAAGEVILSDVHSAQGAIQVTAGGQITATSIGSDSLVPAAITLTSLTGSIGVGSIGSSAGALGHVTLIAAGSIQPLGPDSLPIRAASLDLHAGTGEIFVAALGDVIVGAVAGGRIGVSAAGSLTVSGGIYTGGSPGEVLLSAGRDLTIPAGASVAAVGGVRLAFGQAAALPSTAMLTGQIASLVGVEVNGGAGPDSIVVNSPRVFAAPLATLLGNAGNDSIVLQPQVEAAVSVRGGALGGALGGGSGGDLLELDLSASAADPAGMAIVSAALASRGLGGNGVAIVTAHRYVTFGELDGLVLRDEGVLVGVGLGDLYVRGSQGDDVVEVGIVEVGPASLAGRVLVRVNDQRWTLPAAGRTLIAGRGGNDTLTQSGLHRPVELQGGDGDDVLTGDTAADVLQGGEGRDTLYGQGGDDYLSGDAGDDTLFGGAENDRLFGGSGRDALYGDDGADVLAAGDGRDQLYGGAGFDVLAGGLGPDRLSGDAGDDLLVNGRMIANGGSAASARVGDAYDQALAAVVADWSIDGRLDASLEILSDSSSDQLFGGDGVDTASASAGDSGDWEQVL